MTTSRGREVDRRFRYRVERWDAAVGRWITPGIGIGDGSTENEQAAINQFELERGMYRGVRMVVTELVTTERITDCAIDGETVSNPETATVMGP